LFFRLYLVAGGLCPSQQKTVAERNRAEKMKARQDRDETNIFARGDDLLEEEKEP
jgi:hypothetical protein